MQNAMMVNDGLTAQTALAPLGVNLKQMRFGQMCSTTSPSFGMTCTRVMPSNRSHVLPA